MQYDAIAAHPIDVPAAGNDSPDLDSVLADIHNFVVEQLNQQRARDRFLENHRVRQGLPDDPNLSIVDIMLPADITEQMAIEDYNILNDVMNNLPQETLAEINQNAENAV